MNSGLVNAVPFRSGSFLSFSLRACFSSGYLLRPFFFYSLSFLRSFRFLFAVGENSHRRQGRTALSACDLHKISILEARPEKSIDESCGARWWISSTKTGPFRFNVHGAYHKREIVIFTARFDFAVASHILSSFHPPHSPPYVFDPPATSQFLSHFVSINDLLASLSAARFPRFLRVASPCTLVVS